MINHLKKEKEESSRNIIIDRIVETGQDVLKPVRMFVDLRKWIVRLLIL